MKASIRDTGTACGTPEWTTQTSALRNLLLEKTWFGFDLDDTLHEFKKASKAATDAITLTIHRKYGTSVDNLRKTFSQVSAEQSSRAFTDGGSSSDYRRDRLTRVLGCFSVPTHEPLIGELLQEYEEILMESLELKRGAAELLDLLRDMGKKIAVISEGPQDAQERTLKALGIADRIDLLTTSNYFKVSKTDGLFKDVLERLNIEASDMVFIGDSEQRDILPARKEGILSIHYVENQQSSWDIKVPKLNSFQLLRDVLSRKEA